MLSIIIVNFKNPPLLRLCLKSLEQNLNAGFDYETIIVDSESSVETQNLTKEEFPKFKLLPFKTNIGYTKAVNEGIKASEGDFVLILNPDIILLKNAVETMYDFMKKNKEIGLLGPQLLNFDGTRQNSCFKFYNPLTILYRRSFLGYLPFAKKVLNNFLMTDANLTKTAKEDWLMGSAIMASKKAVGKVGLIDENFFLYMSDVDWARRFWENGYEVVYYPEVKIYHYHKRVSYGRFGIFDFLFKKETRWHLKDALKYFKKYGLFNTSRNSIYAI